MKLGERGSQLQKDQDRQQLVERLIRKTQDGTIGQKDDGNSSDPTDDEDMAVSVGDQIETHHHYPPPQQAAKEDNGSTLSKWALAAGLLAVGLGGGALAASMLKGDNPPAVSDDTNTKYGLKLYEEES